LRSSLSEQQRTGDGSAVVAAVCAGSTRRDQSLVAPVPQLALARSRQNVELTERERIPNALRERGVRGRLRDPRLLLPPSMKTNVDPDFRRYLAKITPMRYR
jgi:hypothetical protein